jgi:uncharacterized protein YdhG (YjbR/CyaY superfamily)
MRSKKFIPADVDTYISNFPEAVQIKLNAIRVAIRKAAPNAEEAISYMIPTFKLNGNLVHFAGYKTHIGFYPGPAGIEAFKNELVSYETSKGTVQFPLDKPLPLKMISAITKFRAIQNLEKSKVKKVKPIKKK